MTFARPNQDRSDQPPVADRAAGMRGAVDLFITKRKVEKQDPATLFGGLVDLERLQAPTVMVHRTKW